MWQPLTGCNGDNGRKFDCGGGGTDMVIEDHASKVGEMNVKTKKWPFLE